ncbi:dual-specificity kinase [Pyrrhoderma noxium]|uniref:Dual-specificity kinase n=1 Tax=Pyrrhoderma noxium TaxID=2282107 RepID=A0A286UI06_9AGAM|nr:dual-specificity kinase [Pyrrhoderma noxium]
MLARSILSLAAFAGFAAAQLEILAPGGPNLWWVANSENNIVWNCKESQISNFTVLLSNSDPKILVSAQAIVAIQENFDCSKTLTTQQANFTAATGYRVIFANTLNSSDVYAQTDEFEVKAQGSAYPDPSSTPTADSGSSTATGSGSSASSTSSSANESTSSSAAFAIGPQSAGALLIGAFAALVL